MFKKRTAYAILPVAVAGLLLAFILHLAAFVPGVEAEDLSQPVVIEVIENTSDQALTLEDGVVVAPGETYSTTTTIQAAPTITSEQFVIESSISSPIANPRTRVWLPTELAVGESFSVIVQSFEWPNVSKGFGGCFNITQNWEEISPAVYQISGSVTCDVALNHVNLSWQMPADEFGLFRVIVESDSLPRRDLTNSIKTPPEDWCDGSAAWSLQPSWVPDQAFALAPSDYCDNNQDMIYQIGATTKYTGWDGIANEMPSGTTDIIRRPDLQPPPTSVSLHQANASKQGQAVVVLVLIVLMWLSAFGFFAWRDRRENN